MSSKAAILARIREALREPAPMPGIHGAGALEHGEAPKNFSEWLPNVGETLDEQVAQFARNSEDLKTEFRVVAKVGALSTELCKLGSESGWKRIATHHGELTDKVASQLKLPTLLTDVGYLVGDLEQCDAGITECDALVAQTGSVLITSKSAGGRALSVLPPHHVVLARREQIVPDLPAAYALLRERYGAAWPSFMSFITGPSRTGDIERILVLGAHGPKRLTVFLV